MKVLATNVRFFFLNSEFVQIISSSVFQIEREISERKQTDEDSTVHDSDTESERDAREHTVRF